MKLGRTSYLSTVLRADYVTGKIEFFFVKRFCFLLTIFWGGGFDLERTFLVHFLEKKKYLDEIFFISLNQCCGSETIHFRTGSGSYLPGTVIMDSDPSCQVNTDPDPTFQVISDLDPIFIIYY